MKAFPRTNGVFSDELGMDLRDYFAAKATEVDIETYQWEKTVGYGIVAGTQIRTREQAKYAYADAMMEARK